MTYIDGFILPISDDKVADYTPMAETFARKAKEQGALGSLEALGDKNAEEAANFYAATFPDSSVDAVHRSPGDYPDGKAGDVLTVEFTVLGLKFTGLNGGPKFKFDEAISFQVFTDDQAETDRYWNAITTNGGAESRCGWCKDKFGLSWQIVPKRLIQLMTEAKGEAGKRVFGAMMQMQKIDIAALEVAAHKSADA